MTERYIGENLGEAITWAQHQLRTTRPVAESVIFSGIMAKTVIWDDGVILLEADDEFERRKTASILNTQKNFNTAKKWTRLHFRNHNRSRGNRNMGTVIKGKYTSSKLMNNASSSFSDAAEDMLASYLVGLSSAPPTDEDEQP